MRGSKGEEVPAKPVKSLDNQRALSKGTTYFIDQG